jgi:hypothetical protein
MALPIFPVRIPRASPGEFCYTSRGSACSHPAPQASQSRALNLGTPSLSDAERAAILGDTACKLLRIPS